MLGFRLYFIQKYRSFCVVIAEVEGEVLTLFRMGGEGGKKAPYQFFPCNFCKRKS